ncbi:diguanylate cyclase [Larsenimonas rhizosphaerae]|uniref:diguanylate cyclase n=1 Tax=Larsenimonas rhizosphaerae TaxID=2944682 RepID=A0AA41ZIL0_9GAMM|nr:diguanylate cyclase [Larsenimonas rhizosphaerae]MCM2129892.1 diguanylate cyclase [Larsenimonas rhizosphaerae]MCX2524553.1 diguanylate cyclase [Larsenimonas rhizosphaerae]
MATPDASLVQQQLANLKESYKHRLAEDLVDLERCTTAMLAEQGNREMMASLCQSLHRIAGSAGTFGWTEVGAACREMEQQTQIWLKRADDVAPEALEMIRARLRALIGHMHKAASDGDTPPRIDFDAGSEYTDAAVTVVLLGLSTHEGEHMADALKGFGYAIRFAAEAGDILSMSPAPDVLVADQNVLTMSLRAYISRDDVPTALIQLNRLDTFERRLHAVRCGAQGYFTYPIDIPRLEARLRRLATRHTQDPYRVVIVDDDVELSEHFRLVLQAAGIDSRVVNTPSMVVAALHDHMPDILIVDINMPGCSGPELAQVLRLDDDWLKVPIIYLSAETDQDRRTVALRQAGDDFLAKPISDLDLINAVKVRSQRSRQLSEALERDGLTGLMKHAALKEQLDIEVSRAQRSGEPASVVMIDIDHFKSVNDTYGHATGDYVIRLLANLLRRRLRKVDTVGRYGGEEFVAILPNCDAENAARIFNEIRMNFSQLDCVSGEQSFRVSFSAGIATTASSGEGSVLLEIADQAMYQAKTGGRNKVCVSEPTD